MGKKSKLGAALAGLGIGVGLGLLFAPKSGKETRSDLKKASKKAVKKVKEVDLNKLKEDLVASFDNLKNELANMDKETAKKIATKKAKDIQAKANDLIDLAKEKSAPVVEKTAKDVKKKLAETLKDLSAKLED